jgi:hypothetical protein
VNPIRSAPLLSLALLLAGPAPAVPTTPAPPLAGHELTVLGTLAPRHARDIASSPWSIGGETLDRDFATYDHYKPFLGPLGAKGLRLQAGWAKCEKSPGVYSFEWLDAIVDDARVQGVQPWLEFNYGNPVYPDGGDTGLGGGFPTSPEALAAWDRWVRALVTRFRDRVHEWEVWNEPDINNRGTAPVDQYVDLYLRTAAIVRELQPAGKLYALALAHEAGYAERFLDAMKARGRLDLIDAITIHGYPRNPDDTSLTDRLRGYLRQTIGRDIPIRQGETGATSRFQENFALRHIAWTENLQAKWNLRRLLAHRAKDVPMNLFTLSDMHYRQGNNTSGNPDGVLRMNYKGLVGTNPDQTVSHVKIAYGAAQAVFTVFDDSLGRIADFPFSTTSLRGVALTGYARADGAQVAAYWFHDAPPAESNGVTLADFNLPKGRFTEPVLVDLRSGTVFALPRDRWSQDDRGAAFRRLPVYDSPLLIAERRAIPLAPAAR